MARPLSERMTTTTDSDTALIGRDDAGIRGSRVRGRTRRATRPRRPRTAFVLSGGASLGALQVGMLRALYERGITADLFVGTSIGALNAAFVASRPQTPATATELARVWRGIDRIDVFPISLRTVVGGLAGQRDHLVPPSGLRKIVQRHVQFEDLADARVPLHIVAYDINVGGETVLCEGPAIDAVVAACSVPGVFPPVPIGDKLLIDGGVVNNTPIRHAVELGAERVYVLPTSDPSSPRPHSPRTALDAAIYAVSLLVASRLEADIVRYGNEVELVVLPAANAQRVQPTDFDHSSRLTSEALTATREMLAGAVPEPLPLRAA
jgi:NTE family protein